MSAQNLKTPSVLKLITTKQFAHAVGVQGATVRRSLCINGHYLGIRPVKLPNGRLAWPENALAQLIEQAAERR